MIDTRLVMREETLTLEQLNKLALEIAEKNEDLIVQLSYNVNGNHYWGVTLADKLVTKYLFINSLQGGSLEILKSAAKNGIKLPKAKKL